MVFFLLLMFYNLIIQIPTPSPSLESWGKIALRFLDQGNVRVGNQAKGLFGGAHSSPHSDSLAPEPSNLL